MMLSAIQDKSAISVSRLVLFIGLTVKAAGLALVLVLLPPLGRLMGFSDLQTGLVMSASALVAILAAPVWGGVSERMGRKPVLLIGFVSLSICLFLMAAIIGTRLSGVVSASLGLGMMLIVRIAQTGMVAGTVPAAQAFVADTTERKTRVQGMGILGAAFGLGAIVGSSLAWRVGADWPVSAFVGAAALVLAGAIAVLWLLPEPEKAVHDKQSNGAGVNFALLWPHFLVTLVGVSLFSILQQTTALRLQDYFHFAPSNSVAAAGAILAATSLAMILTQGIVLWWLNWTPLQFIVRASVLAALAFVGLWFAPGLELTFASMAVLGASLGLLFPGNLGAMSLASGENVQGKVAGINAVFQGLGMAIGPVTGALLNSVSASAIPLFGLGLCLLIMTVFWPKRRRLS
ncbi:MAG: MFS transporter [Pseudomonadota bacterium]